MKKFLICLFCLPFILLLLSSCASNRNYDASFITNEIDKEKAIVYFYRPNSIIGALRDYRVKSNGNEILIVKNDSLNKVVLDEGIKVFTVERVKSFLNDGLSVQLNTPQFSDPLNINLEKGNIYYIKFIVKPRPFKEKIVLEVFKNKEDLFL